MPSAEYEVKWTPDPSEPIVETYSHIPFAAVRISAEVEASGGGSEGGETRAGADAGGYADRHGLCLHAFGGPQRP